MIPFLEAKGYHVVAVQHPLTSIADDVAAATNHIVDAPDGPVLLVGHSYEGPPWWVANIAGLRLIAGEPLADTSRRIERR
jgi:hypothetical protein